MRPPVHAGISALAPASLVPGRLADPAQSEAGVRADLDGGGLGFSHRLFHRLHQVLSVMDQHLGGLRENQRTFRAVSSTKQGSKRSGGEI